MEHILVNAEASDVLPAPFPHIIIKNAIDPELCSRLAAKFPSLQTLARSSDIGNNQRLNYEAAHALNDRSIAPLWKTFIRANCSQEFLTKLFDLFQNSIYCLYPTLDDDIGRLTDLKAGIRYVDSFDNSDVLLDTIIAANSPVMGRPSAVTRGHVDLPNKLFAGLLYIRHEADDSSGGDLELYCFKEKIDRFRNRFIDDKYIEPVKTIRYENNVLILFINSIASVHGVSFRSVTKFPRLFVNFVGEVRHDLFDLQKYQGKWTLMEQAAWRAKKVLTNLSRHVDR
jgi:hypothetical protein